MITVTKLSVHRFLSVVLGKVKDPMSFTIVSQATKPEEMLQFSSVVANQA